MSKFLNFLHSPAVTHIIGVAGTLAAGITVPNSPAVSIAVATITGITQAAHSFQTVKTQPNVTTNDFNRVLSP